MYIFTTTDRPENKDVFEKLLAFVLHAQGPVELVMVLMDVRQRCAGACPPFRRSHPALYLQWLGGGHPPERGPEIVRSSALHCVAGAGRGLQRSTGMPEEAALKKWLPGRSHGSGVLPAVVLTAGRGLWRFAAWQRSKVSSMAA